MSYQLVTPKRLLTLHSNKLESAITRFKSERLETLSVAAAEDDSRPTFIRESTVRLEEAIGAIEEANVKIRELLQNYAETLSAIPDPPEKETKDFEEYTTKAEGTLIAAFDYTILLQGRLRAFKSCKDGTSLLPATSSLQVPSSSTSQARKVDLPTIPIPLFKGNIWEWDNFWELFNANVHSQDLPALFKFNHLLNALKGEALESVQKFQVNAENYPIAIAFLKNKYGNSEELVFRLIDKLESCSLRSPAIRDQRALFEQIQVLVEQLKSKNEDVNSQWLLKKILCKFPEHIQRKVLLKKQADNCEFTMGTMLKYLEDTISSEEMISAYIGRPATPKIQERSEQKHKPLPQTYISSCMYCGKNHKSGECDKYKSPQERSQYLRERKLCLICASPYHATTVCKKPPCFKCKKPHHTSCCFQFEKKQQMGTGVKKDGDQNARATVKARQIRKADRGTLKVNNIGQDSTPEEETSILEMHSEKISFRAHDTFLPTGQATVLDPNTRVMRKITVLIDTGAQVSFIDATLANELQLPAVAQVKLKIRTFGTKDVREKTCRRVNLQIWDIDGNPLSLSLLTYDVLTSSFVTPPIRQEDVKFVEELNLPILTHDGQSVTKPLILLGCDQLWPLIHDDKPHVKLPSGLHLLPTRLGHLLTGQLRGNQPDDDDYWTIDEPQVNTLIQSYEDTEDKKRWETFWELETAGTEEFMSSEKEIQAQEDQKVWEEFNKTIEKRTDGYYVRLPWKNVSATLPNNRAIAFRRLVSLWNSLQQNTDLLQRYNEIFQEQLELNILEDVREDAPPSGPRVHYIPHQAVLTPRKATTKLRIVYDASAHHKGCPSLNDVLHRGPVILPQIYGVLLRFRIGQIGIISDVEKAFLQVRLHESDRDATRCLWLHDHKLPPSPENVRVLRFTRVTFGLNSSPFLLAGTTHFHLNQYGEDIKLIADIKENLYVDNLVLSMDTLEEAVESYSRTKKIFNDLNMNIREFVSNDIRLRDLMAEKDKSVNTCPKVLGVPWSSTTDTLEISCELRRSETVTKRAVASTIASVYDPLGWLAPLMHRSKIFLRSLWKDQYDWDTQLPSKLQYEWRQICDGMQGFKKVLPRHLTGKQSEVMLITFADASTEAIASCVYLRSPESCHIIMAKTKLPSLKAKSTIPKMELDALTLAMRLTNSVLSQLQSVVRIQQVCILTDSEIVLSWIKSRPLQKLSVMIFNRLNEIGKITSHLESLGVQVCFGHIPSQYNAADCATRGLSQFELQDHLWWNGPSMLREAPENWTNICKFVDLSRNPGEESDSLPVSSNALALDQIKDNRAPRKESGLFDILAGQSLLKIKIVVAYVLRFIQNLVRRTNENRVHPIQVSPMLCNGSETGTRVTGTEIKAAGKILVKTHQRSIVTPYVSRSMHHLNIKPDSEGLLRCYGRLQFSELSTDAKNPLIILQNSWLAEAIISDYAKFCCAKHEQLRKNCRRTLQRKKES
uniref:DUF1758 domain-containing protein n=1 Tax=Haemonchus contortus TaxID=6289 RepID=A0A7I5E7X4_HAECO|nr:Protein of unknown function DUF1759 and Protein of unknown function DUF1758 and Retrotransposon domain containing protein [Haemonchus contortus]